MLCTPQEERGGRVDRDLNVGGAVQRLRYVHMHRYREIDRDQFDRTRDRIASPGPGYAYGVVLHIDG